jgi:hypothetical protein
MSLHKEKKTGEESTKLRSCYQPWVGGNKERVGENVLSVSGDQLVRDVLSFALRKKNRNILLNGKISPVV